MRLTGIIRRARRLKITTVWLHAYHILQWPGAPSKHLKIDDEERQLNEDIIFETTPRSIIIAMIKLLLLLLLILLFLAILIAYLIYKPPKPIMDWFQRKYPDVIFHHPLPASQRVVALTIDDAPSPSTNQMLDLLKTHNAKATFFIIGNQISGREDIIKRIHAEGHELGNHGWADEPAYKLPLPELERQIHEMEALLPENLDGRKWFRPGWGWFSKEMVNLLKGLGYRMALASVYPHDAQIPHPKINAAHVLSMVKPGGIILMHDRRDYSATQLEIVLKGLSETGWKLESLGGLMKIADDGWKKA